MTNSQSLALVVVSLGGTVTGRTNAGLLADIVRALGGTPTGDTNADLIGEIASALGGEAGEGTNADRLRAVAEALDIDASGTNAEVLAAILTGLGGEPGPKDTNATLILGLSEHPPVEKFTVRYHVATASAGYGSVSSASTSGVEGGTAIAATTSAVQIGGVTKCTATPEPDTAEYEYAFVSWTGADDDSTPAPTSITANTHYFAHFSRTPVGPQPMDPSLFTFTVADGEATVTGWAGTPPADGYDLVFPETDGDGHPVTAVGGWADSTGSSAWTGAASAQSSTATIIKQQAFRGCTSLTTVDLPAVTNVGAYAFNGCTSLTTVDLPAVESVGYRAFEGCTGVTHVALGPMTGTYDSGAFYSWTFYDTDGETALDKTVAANLANSTFAGTYDHLVKQP